jgi:hypothetical protein
MATVSRVGNLSLESFVMRRRARESPRPFLARVVGVALVAGCSDDPQLSEEQGWAEWARSGGGTYEKNPEVTLAREYWAITVLPDGTRGLNPRPDGDPDVREECRAGGPLAEMFRRAELCESAASPAAAARVNALDATVARRTSTFLHSKLDFTLRAGIYPAYPAHNADLIAVCQRFPDDREGILRQYCDWVMTTGARILAGPPLSAEGVRRVGEHLNAIYGIR